MVAVCARYRKRKAMVSKAPCALTLISAAPDAWVQHESRHIDGRTIKGVKVDEEKLEAVSEFCYLSAGSGCELAAVTCCKASSANWCPFSPPQSAPCEQR